MKVIITIRLILILGSKNSHEERIGIIFDFLLQKLRLKKVPSDGCTGLDADWTDTIGTSIKFPVVTGTVVEVTCSDLQALNKGSINVTCTSGNEFSFVKRPSCSRPGNLRKECQ